MKRRSKAEVQQAAREVTGDALRDVDAGSYQVSEPSREEKYPNAVKLSENADERRTATEFLEWLEENGYHVCERSPGSNFDTYHRTLKNFDDLVLAFIGVDKAKLEEERRAMIKVAREAVGDTSEDE